MKKKRKLAERIITVLLLSVFLYAAFQIGQIVLGYYDNQKVLAEVQEIHREYQTKLSGSAQAAESETEIRSSFDHLQEINQDMIGWIRIEDTPINYPILQASDNDYYLDRNYKEEQADAGSIFMDYRNDLEDMSANTVVYGHRMKDNSMFGSLKKYGDESFYQAHRYIQFDTIYGSYKAEIFAVYQTDTDFNYIQTDFTDASDYENLIQEIQEKAIYRTDVKVDADDRILTLSTCDSIWQPKQNRLVVHAKLTKQ
ncbi:sortase B [Terribacillus halophilus]|uniref:Sortase B n=1 Tax=Terribacillus halophilus TaxID=361279 RepID=A0A1G6LBN7_9BACI|nr:class B sortase [Terribacillus halophilus]SDC40056.1 sortase B [Terribacillus halophilus]